MEFVEKFELDKLDYICELKEDDFKSYLIKTDFFSKSLSNQKEIKSCFFNVKNIVKNAIKNNGENKVNYSYTNGNNNGRLFGKGVQQFPSKIRGFLCSNTTDIDMTNAHPTILLYLCKQHNIECNKLEYFVNNRELVYKQHTQLDRTDAKLFYLHTLFQHYPKTTDVLFYNEFRNEIQSIHIKLSQIFTIYYNKTQQNPFGTMLSNIINEYENNILQVVINHIQSKNLTISTLMFDGLMIHGNHYDNKDLLSSISDDVESKFPSLNMKFTFKEHDDTIKLPDNYKIKSPYNKTIEWINSLTTNVGIVHELERRVPDKFIWVKKIHYAWDGYKWTDDRCEFDKYVSSKLLKIITTEVFNLCKTFKDEIQLDKNGDSVIFSTLLQSQKCLTDLCSVKNKLENGNFIDAVFKKAESFFTNNDIEFDMKEHLIGFKNGCFDTEKWEFRNLKHDDYITMSCGYDYNECVDNDKLETIESILKQIHPDNEIRSLWLQTLAKGFHGRCAEYFVIFNGEGGNGKGMIDEYMGDIFGDYIVSQLPTWVLTDKNSSGPCPEKANMDKKRLLITKEPSGKDKLRVDNIRDISGGGKMSARDVFMGKKNTSIKNTWITIMECNKKPLLNEEPQEAEVRRFIDIHFGSTFVNNEMDVDIENRIYLKNTEYKTTEWKLEHRDAMVQILLKHLKIFIDNDFKFKIPLSVQKRTDEYLMESFPILEVFMNLYEKTGDDNDFIKIKDVINSIKSSDIYNTFTRADKRKYNDKHISDFIKSNKYFKKHYKERLRIKDICDTQALVGFKSISGDGDDDIECVL